MKQQERERKKMRGVHNNVVHHSLEGCGGVAHAKKHDGRFKYSIFGLECHFPLISVFDAYIVVAPLDVQFGEILGSFQLVDEFRDEGEKIAVLDGSFIEFSVILTGHSFPSFLSTKKNGEAIGDFNGLIYPFARFLLMNLSNLSCSGGESR